MALLIKHGRIVTADDDFVADIYCEDQTITRIERDIELPATPGDLQVIDATDKLVFPGFIDPHVHIHMPFMGTCCKDDYTSASKAALLGGTTTLIEMCCPSKSDDLAEAFAIWRGKAEGKSACDYSFHMGVSRFDQATEKQLRAIVAEGIASFKVFLAYKGAFDLDDAGLYQTLKLAKELGVIVTAHCENAELIACKQAELVRAGKVGPEFHEPSRPVTVEADGVHHLLSFAQATGAHVYVVHTSCKEALQAALDARQRGTEVWIETVIPYLMLDNKCAQQKDFQGAKYVMSPPIRDQQHQQALWDALAVAQINTVATDHAPFDFAGQKDMGKPPRGDFTTIPNGLPSVEHRVDLLYTYGVMAQRIDMKRFVDCASTQAAKIFGLFPRKGAIQVGSDADLVVYDPHHPSTINAKTHHMNVDYSAYEGVRIQGRACYVTVRGQIQVSAGQFTGAHAHGQLLKRQPTHF